jgi:hypothetical protein
MSTSECWTEVTPCPVTRNVGPLSVALSEGGNGKAVVAVYEVSSSTCAVT